MELDADDKAVLEKAVTVLEQPGFGIKVLDYLGKPIEYGLKMLPENMSTKIQEITKVSLEKAFTMVTADMEGASNKPASQGLHRGMATLTGAIGGAFGLPALAVELPISTGIILRSIAEIARQEGENVKEPDTQVSCLEVFALGGRSDADDAAESAYLATRMAIAAQVNEAAKFVARQGASKLTKDAGPPLVRLIAQIAARFGVTVSEKAAAQMVPLLGAVGGATINHIFIKHFQDIAGGHFTVRRLERKYGKEVIETEYRNILCEKVPAKGELAA